MRRAEPAIRPGVHLVDGAFLRVRVLVFDDARNGAGAIAHDAPVARRILHPHAQHAERFATRGRFDERCIVAGCTSGTSPNSTSTR